MSSIDRTTPLSQYTIDRLNYVNETFPGIEEAEDRYLFMILNNHSAPACRMEYTYEVGDKICKLDRFKNTLPVENTMLKVDGYFFNGNKVSLLNNQPFIATQAPHKQHEAIDLKEELFWQVIVDHQVSAVMNLTGVTELCDTYTAKELGQSLIRKGITETHITDTFLEKDEDAEHYLSTRHLVTIGKKDSIVEGRFTYIKASEWVDFGATSLERLSALVDKIEQIRKAFTDRPILVHCRAGVGRTGTFIVACAIKALAGMGEIRAENYKQYVAALVLSIRDQRGPETVQRPVQLLLLLDYARSLLR